MSVAQSGTGLASAVAAPRAPRSGVRHVLRKLASDRFSLAGAVILLLLTLGGFLVPVLSDTNPTATDLPNRFKPPLWLDGGTLDHPLGTDSLGRDVLIRLLFGARISLTIGVVAALIAMAIGVPLGLIAGYFGGAFDAVIMRIGDVQLGFPTILLYVSALTVIQPGLWNMIVILGIAGWVVHARVIRAQVLAQRRMEYVEAARTVGAIAPLIVVRHVLPNVLAPTIVITSFSVATFIITASSLSFLGLGLPPATPDWGLMIADAVKYIRIAWWPSTFAGLALSLTVFGVNVLGDWLRDYLDPRLRLG
jgi:peptide/nickel transport system permease protein